MISQQSIDVKKIHRFREISVLAALTILMVFAVKINEARSDSEAPMSARMSSSTSAFSTQDLSIGSNSSEIGAGSVFETVDNQLLIEPNLIAGDFSFNPRWFWWTYPHEERGPNDDSRWFLGEDTAEEVPYWGDYIVGADLGVSVNFWGRTFFYMGDTWNRNSASRLKCDQGAICDDAILELSLFETYPDNGIDVIPFRDENEKFIPQSIPGIHTDVFDPDFWDDYPDPDDNRDPNFTVPTGGDTVPIFHTLTVGDRTYNYSVPTIMLWYSTASNPARVIHSNPKRTPRSWVGCSTNGLDFENCYDPAVPFSEDKPGKPARFIQVSPVPVTYWDLQNMCGNGGYDRDNPLCEPEIYDDEYPIGGVLLYGNGRHYRYSGLYVAYLRNDEIGEVDVSGKPIVHYLTKVGGEWTWTEDEADAKRILPLASWAHNACDGVLSRTTCEADILLALTTNPGLKNKFFGEFSAKMIRHGIEDDEPPAIVMLSGHGMIADEYDNVRLRMTTLDKFWQWGPAQSTGAVGYGPYMIDAFTEYDSAGDGSLTLWFLTSKWGYGPYGVYSDFVEISPWP